MFYGPLFRLQCLKSKRIIMKDTPHTPTHTRARALADQVALTAGNVRYAFF